MTSSFPPAGQEGARLRPRYLVAAMIVTWFVGVQGLTIGLHIAAFLRHGNVPALEANGGALEARDAARLKALGDMREVAFPLSVAQILLSGLLVVTSGLAMGGRRGARSLALQALAAHVAFSAVDYALTRQVRGAGSDAFAAASAHLAGDPAKDLGWMFGWWGERVKAVVFHGATVVFGVVALTRERTKAFFAAVARQAERAEEEP